MDDKTLDVVSSFGDAWYEDYYNVKQNVEVVCGLWPNESRAFINEVAGALTAVKQGGNTYKKHGVLLGGDPSVWIDKAWHIPQWVDHISELFPLVDRESITQIIHSYIYFKWLR